MCGIIGYVGEKNAYPLLKEGLKTLEYRGYDSAGISILDGDLSLERVNGQVDNLPESSVKGSTGIGHTRWATHGEPSEKNAHPHLSCDRKIALVHNGIIENYLELKEELSDHTFSSETDSEILVHLIEEQYDGDLLQAVIKTMSKCKGTWGIAVMHEETQEIIVARNGSPLLIGVSENENFISSDISGVIKHTNKVIYLGDLEFARVTADSLDIVDRKGERLEKEATTVDWDVESVQKGDYQHYMLKEIHEQPDVVKRCLGVDLPTIEKPKRILFLACGTPTYVAGVARYVLEEMCGIPCVVEAASEFRYKKTPFFEGDLAIVISQSGETADTLAALRIAKEAGVTSLGIINVCGSTISREVDDVIYTPAGPEIGVASTKAFTSQLTLLYRLAEQWGAAFPDLKKMPVMMEGLLQDTRVEDVARTYFKAHNFLYIGRKFSYPIALEGALKLKEISYIHAEGYPAGELKHGPLALVTDRVPVVCIAPHDSVHDKMISNIQEIRARRGKVIAIATQGDASMENHADDVLHIPQIQEELTPLLSIIPLQLLAYHIALLRECDIDKPRNLAKSVTVE